jgi:hypothetical protein
VTWTTGVLGGRWRAAVSAWGAVVPGDGSLPLDWAVAADDRWHRPAEEVAVRQRRDGGTPVLETRLRIPGGDAVHRVWSVPDGGGLTLVEVHNDSPLPIAVAFTRPDLLTSRPPTDVPIEGIELPAGTIVLPVGHRTRVTVGLAHDGRGAGPLPGGISDAGAVARGWRLLAERAGRLDLPDPRLGDAVIAARCDVLLAGPPAADVDPVVYLVALGELARLGELDRHQAGAVSADVAWAVEHIARRDGWDVDAALDAAAVVLARAGERRAGRDLARLVADRRAATGPGPVPADADLLGLGVLAVPAVERRLARGPVLFPDGIPPAWRGAPIEAHGLMAGPATTISLAVRWHGEHPAVLWELDGDLVPLTAPAVAAGWTTRERAGETLWRSRGDGARALT